MNIQTIDRKTKVVSISLEPAIMKILESLSKKRGQSRSAVISSLLKNEKWEEEWKQIRKWGDETAKRLKITSEEDVYKLLGDA